MKIIRLRWYQFFDSLKKTADIENFHGKVAILYHIYNIKPLCRQLQKLHQNILQIFSTIGH